MVIEMERSSSVYDAVLEMIVDRRPMEKRSAEKLLEITGLSGA
jgi:hypothetical protein